MNESSDGAAGIAEYNQGAAVATGDPACPYRLDAGHFEADVGGEADPVDPAFEQRSTAAQRRIGAPSRDALPLRRVERHEPYLSKRPCGHGAAKVNSDWFVVVILGDHDALSGHRCCFGDDLCIGGAHECGLFNDDMPPGLQCHDCQLTMRHCRCCDDNDIDTVIAQRALIRTERSGAPEPGAQCLSAHAIPAREREL